MKKNILKALSAVTALCAVMTFCGCAQNTSSTAETSKPATADTSDKQTATTAPQAKGEFDIKSLQMYDTASSDPFAGAWRITEGEGSKLGNFTFVFDGNGKAILLMETMGYIEKYSENTDSTLEGAEGKSTFSCQLMFGINGIYTYEFSNSNSTVVLTNTDGGKTTTMEKMQSLDFIPIPDENPAIDSDLVGAWKSENGEYFYFAKNGVMYQNQMGKMFTYYKYSAKDNTITATYTMQDEVTETYEYLVEEDKLTMDKYEYTRISPDELI